MTESTNLRIRTEVWQRRVKAFLFCAIASFTLACVAWSISTPRFVSESRIGLGLIRHGGPAASEADVDRLIESTWAGVAGDENLQAIWREVWIEAGGDNANTDGEVPQLPTGISHQTRRRGGWCEVAITATGSGSPNEKRMLDRLAVQMASELALVPYRQLVQTRHRQSHEMEFTVQLGMPQRACEALADQVATLASRLREYQAEGTTTLADASRDDEQRQQALEEERSRLQSRRSELNRELQRLDGLDPAQPSLARIRDQLFDLETQLEKVEEKLMLADVGMGARPSPFQYASQSRESSLETALSAETTFSELASIEVQARELGRQLGTLQSRLDTARQLTQPPAIEPVPVFVRSFEPARVVAQSGYGTVGILAMIALGSMLIGSVIAWRYRPFEDDLGFDSPEQLSRTLNLPVTATLNRRSSDDDTIHEPPLANLAVRTAELIVLTALVLIACLLIFSPEIRASFANNPLHGLSEILWKIQGK